MTLPAGIGILAHILFWKTTNWSILVKSEHEITKHCLIVPVLKSYIVGAFIEGRVLALSEAN